MNKNLSPYISIAISVLAILLFVNRQLIIEFYKDTPPSYSYIIENVSQSGVRVYFGFVIIRVSHDSNFTHDTV